MVLRINGGRGRTVHGCAGSEYPCATRFAPLTVPRPPLGGRYRRAEEIRRQRLFTRHRSLRSAPGPHTGDRHRASVGSGTGAPCRLHYTLRARVDSTPTQTTTLMSRFAGAQRAAASQLVGGCDRRRHGVLPQRSHGRRQLVAPTRRSLPWAHHQTQGGFARVLPPNRRSHTRRERPEGSTMLARWIPRVCWDGCRS